MLNTFSPGDTLFYVHTKMAEIAPGDVIVFYVPDLGVTVHRVIEIIPTRLITRGDNNYRVDAHVVNAETFIGQVTHVQGVTGKIRPVRIGKNGLFVARLKWWLLGLDLRLRLTFRPLYFRLRQCKPLRRGLWRVFSPHLTVIRLQTPDTVIFKTTFRGRTVARWYPQKCEFECLKPFDLFIDPPNPAARIINPRNEI